MAWLLDEGAPATRTYQSSAGLASPDYCRIVPRAAEPCVSWMQKLFLQQSGCTSWLADNLAGQSCPAGSGIRATLYMFARASWCIWRWTDAWPGRWMRECRKPTCKSLSSPDCHMIAPKAAEAQLSWLPNHFFPLPGCTSSLLDITVTL